MEIWRDKTFGKTGIWAWLLAMGPLILVAMFSMIAFQTDSIKDIFGFVILLLLPAAWGSFYLSQMRHVLQQIVIDDDSISGKFYLGRKIVFLGSDIKSINFYKLTWLAKSLNFLDWKNPGIDITLKTGEALRISHKMDDFDGLANALRRFGL